MEINPYRLLKARSERLAAERLWEGMNPVARNWLKSFGVTPSRLFRKNPRTVEPEALRGFGGVTRDFSSIIEPPYDAARLQEVYERHWVVRTCVDKLVREVARKGWHFDPLFEAKCSSCGAEYETMPTSGTCPACAAGGTSATSVGTSSTFSKAFGTESTAAQPAKPPKPGEPGSTLAKPDESQLKEAKEFLKRPNPKLTLTDLVKRFARDLLIFDDAYISEVMSPQKDGDGVSKKLGDQREWWPEDARYISLLADAKGRLGGKRFCPVEEGLKPAGTATKFYAEAAGSPCPTGDEGVLLEAAYLQRVGAAVNSGPGAEAGVVAAFSPDEVLHTNVFAVGSRLFGTPKLWALQTQITAMSLIDAYQREAFDKLKTPNNVFLLKGVAEDSLRRLMRQFREEKAQNLMDDFWIPVPNWGGAAGQVGLERIPALETPLLAGSLGQSEWYFKNICYTFGVDPAALGVETPGRLGGAQEGAVGKGVSLETINDLQVQISEAFDAFIKVRWPGIKDFKWSLETAHEEEESQVWDVKLKQLQAAKLAVEVGLNVEIDEAGVPKYSGAVDQEQIKAEKAEQFAMQLETMKDRPVGEKPDGPPKPFGKATAKPANIPGNATDLGGVVGATSSGVQALTFVPIERDPVVPANHKVGRIQKQAVESEDPKIEAIQQEYKKALDLFTSSLFSSLKTQIDDVFGYEQSATETVSMDLADAMIKRLSDSLEENLPKGEAVLLDQARRAFAAGAAAGSRQVAKQFEGLEMVAALDEPDLAALEAAGARSVESMRNTLFFGDRESYLSEVKRITRQAAEENWTTARLADELRKQLDPDEEHFSGAMWERIARTDPATFVTMGRLNAYKGFGIPRVRWVAASDASDVCAENDGRTFPVDEAYGLVPAHPNCRCALAPSFGD